MNTDAYIPYTQIVNRLPISQGDILYICSDILGIAKTCRDHGESFDCAKFIKTLQEAVGETGTLMFPTFNWDFCKGIPYNYTQTRGKTGSLGNAALTMPGFKRTLHPLYSFAVWGKDQDYLVQQNPVSAFGNDTPFAYMLEKQAKAFSIGISPLQGNTFIHYIEQSIGVPYRYHKPFTADYIDEAGNVFEKSCTMYVRDLELNLKYVLQPMEHIINQLNINKSYIINTIPYHFTDLCGLYQVVKLDILYNQSRNMCQY